jgi:hypothetical protein
VLRGHQLCAVRLMVQVSDMSQDQNETNEGWRGFERHGRSGLNKEEEINLEVQDSCVTFL